jgi:hypothetical protein
MQAGTIAASGAAQNVQAPCAAEGFRIYSNAFTFTFQYATRASEIAASSGVQAGQAVGAAVSAEETSATDFWIEVPAPLGNPFVTGEVIGAVVGHNGDTLFIRPIRPGGR